MKVIIIEDEVLAVRHLQAILNEIGEVSIIVILETISDAVKWFNSNPHPDLVFMDIHLADGSAFEIFERTQIVCPVIFTTAYDEYALKAFKVNSIDYLLKPIEIESVQIALRKFRTLQPKSDNQDDLLKIIKMLNTKMSYKTHFLVPAKGDKLIPLDISEIAFIHIENNVVKGQTFTEKSFYLENTMDELAAMLNPKDFFRANRQFIIARNSVKDMDLWFNSRLSVNLKMNTPDKIYISKTKVAIFKKWLSGN